MANDRRAVTSGMDRNMRDAVTLVLIYVILVTTGTPIALDTGNLVQ
jgi:hypothetical protein